MHLGRQLGIALLTACATIGVAANGVRQTPGSADAAIDAIFEPWNRADSPGCTVGAIRDGRFVFRKGYGMANLDYAIPNSPAMVYYVGSVSKQFTAAAIALLAQEGRISLDDPVRRHITELPDYGTPMTLRHLVHHTSGLRDIYTLMSLGGIRMEDVFPDEDALALIARQRALNFAPGEDYLYSNSGYWLLGQIVERVTGESLREYARRAIFEPLGMSRTHFHDDPGPCHGESGGQLLAHRRSLRRRGSRQLRQDRRRRALHDDRRSAEVGRELLRPARRRRALARRDADGRPSQQRQPADVRLRPHHRHASRFAHGASRRVADGLPRGAAPLSGPAFHGAGALQSRQHRPRRSGRTRRRGVSRRSDVGGANAGARAGGAGGAGGGRGAAPGVAADPSAATPSAAALAAFAGTFRSEEVQADYTIRATDGRLVLERRIAAPTPLVPAGADTFRAGTLRLQFTRDASGRVASFTIEAGRVRNIVFTRVR